MRMVSEERGYVARKCKKNACPVGLYGKNMLIFAVLYLKDITIRIIPL